MLMIRLARVGARKQPQYRVVVIEKDRARNGRSIEVVGTYNPRTEPATVNFKADRIEYWRSKGAQPSEIVAKLLRKRAAAQTEATPLAGTPLAATPIATAPIVAPPPAEVALAEPVATA